MILLQHCLNAEPPGEEQRYCPVFCEMRTGNWGHGKPQAVPTVSSYTVAIAYLKESHLVSSRGTCQQFKHAHLQLGPQKPQTVPTTFLYHASYLNFIFLLNIFKHNLKLKYHNYEKMGGACRMLQLGFQHMHVYHHSCIQGLFFFSRSNWS